jgi:hypothetical protein
MQYLQEVVYRIHAACMYGKCRTLMLLVTPRICAGIVDDYVIGLHVVQDHLSGV